MIIACAAISIILAGGLFGIIMTSRLDHDEQLFVSAGVMVEQATIYRDFMYGHLPNFPLLLSAVNRITDTTHYLLVARTVVFASWVMAAACLVYLGIRWTGSWLIAGCATTLLLTNQLFLGGPGVLATNSFLPIPFAFAGVGLLFRALEKAGNEVPLLFLSGALLSLAIGMKANYLFVAPVAALTLLMVEVRRPLRDRLLRRLVPFAVGGLLAGLPTISSAVLYPSSFFYSVYESSATTHVQYWMARDPTNPTFDFIGKLRYAYYVWTEPTSLVLFVCILGNCAAIAIRDGIGALKSTLEGSKVATIGLMTILAAVVSFVPTPSFDQYFTTIIPFAILFLLALVAASSDEVRDSLRPMILAAAVIAAAISAADYVSGLRATVNVDRWTGVGTHGTAREIRSKICGSHEHNNDCDALVGTLAPIFVLEAGLRQYAELAAGPFVYRQVDYLSAARRAQLPVTSVATVQGLLERRRPTAVLVGFEGDLDEPLEKFARQHGGYAADVTFEGKMRRLYVLGRQAGTP